MTEQLVDLVKTYSVGRNQSSLVVSIPKEVREALGIKAQQKLHVKIDDKGRLIYEPV
jgi:antitoxin component of MazEF toxin-antitoxin module